MGPGEISSGWEGEGNPSRVKKLLLCGGAMRCFKERERGGERRLG